MKKNLFCALSALVLACVSVLSSCKSEIKDSYTLEEFRNASFLWHDEITVTITGLTNADFPDVDIYSEDIKENSCQLSQIIKKHGVKTHLIIAPNDSLTRIGDHSFYFCKPLVSVSIPETVTELGSSFLRCDLLENVEIPNSVSYISEDCFAYCNHLRRLSLPDSILVATHALFNHCRNLENVDLPDGLLNISFLMFRDCESFKKISIPQSVIAIEDAAFYNSNLDSVVIPANVKHIGHLAFSGNKSLRKVVFLGNRDSIRIEDDAFADTPVEKDFALAAIKPAISVDTAGAYTMEEFCNSKFPEGEDVYVAIKDFYTQSPLGSRFSDFLFNCKARLHITLLANDSLKDLNIMGWLNVASLSIPEGVEYIHAETFIYNRFETLLLPSSLKTINASAFYESWNLKNISLPQNIVKVYRYCFYGCSELETVHFPENLFMIDNGAFSNCGKLRDMELPGKLVYLADNVFDGCKSLKTVEIPSSVKYIGKQAFANCDSITKVVIHNSSDNITICSDAFLDCANLDAANIIFEPGK